MTRRHCLHTLALTSLSGLSACQRSENTPLSWPFFAYHTKGDIQLFPPAHMKENDLRSLQKLCGEQITHYQNLLSLQGSQIKELNTQGVLHNPQIELITALDLCRDLHQHTGGLFDPTIQSYWTWLKNRGASGNPPSDAERKEALQRVDFSQVTYNSKVIRLQAGVQLTLNSLAQGMTTDALYQELKNAGIENALVNIGEYRALGAQPNGNAWQIAIDDGRPSAPQRIIPLADAALATSSGRSHRISATSADNHIIDPQTGRSPHTTQQTYSIKAPTAMLADALATCATLMPKEDFAALLKNHSPEASLL